MTNNNQNQPIFTIENGVLKKCNLNGNTDIVLPDTVREIGARAFRSCTNLSRIKCPNVQEIGRQSFSGCEKLTSIELPNVQTIDNDALDGLTSLKEIILSENNPNYYFENGILYNKDQTEIIWCKKDLQSYTAPLSVVKIGDWAFSWCEKLTSIELPNVQEISGNAFAFCASLQEIILSGDNPNYHFEDGILYNKDYTDIIICCKKDLQSYTAPLSVVKIDDYAFYACENLESVSCPNVQEIGWGAFSDCTNLTSIELPDVQEIGKIAFSECKNLSNIECPNVREIGEYAFFRCENLVSIECPNVQEIGWCAFSRCKNLRSIECPNVQEIGEYAFCECENLIQMSIPYDLLQERKDIPTEQKLRIERRT